MTNGGGVTEEARCEKLSAKLGIEITPDQIMQAHTVLRPLAKKYADYSILVLGGKGNNGREVAQSYGFKNVHIPLDILAWNPTIWPFHQLTEEEKLFVRPTDFSKTPIHAIFVLHDPRNWSLDIQIMTDVLRSPNGVVGSEYVPFSRKHSHSQSAIQLAFCNPDLIWRNEYKIPRFGQGAFKEAFQAVFRAATGRNHPYTQFGKPYEVTYKFGEKMLHDLMYKPVSEGDVIENEKDIPPSRIYMIGDNPASDIAGANAASWSSILVRTGVYDPAHAPPAHQPTYEAEDVEEAVKWAFERETGVRL